MTPEQETKLCQKRDGMVGLMDSDEPAERMAALNSYYAFRKKYEKDGFPKLRDLLLNSVTLAEHLKAAEENRALWERAYHDQVKANAALTAQIARPRSAFWLTIDFRKAAVLAIGLAVLYGGSWWFSKRDVRSAQQPAATTLKTDAPRTAPPREQVPPASTVKDGARLLPQREEPAAEERPRAAAPAKAATTKASKEDARRPETLDEIIRSWRLTGSGKTNAR
jgi:hypothetical protein